MARAQGQGRAGRCRRAEGLVAMRDELQSDRTPSPSSSADRGPARADAQKEGIMSSWLARDTPPTGPGPWVTFRRAPAIHHGRSTLSGDLVVDGDAWLIDSDESRGGAAVRSAGPETEQSLLPTARHEVGAPHRPRYLEMWCRLPGRGEFFSRGVNQPLTGTTEWASFQVPFGSRRASGPTSSSSTWSSRAGVGCDQRRGATQAPNSCRASHAAEDSSPARLKRFMWFLRPRSG